MKNLLLGAAALAIVAAIGAAAWFYLRPGEAAKRAVERYGSDALQASVRVERLEISFSEGSGAITGFSVGNPRGFKTPAAFEAGLIKLSLDPASLARDALVIRSVSVTSPRIRYESGDGGSNIDALLRNLRSRTDKAGDAARGGPRLVVDHIVVRDAALSYASAVAAGETVTVPLQDIRLSGIGRSKGGVTPDELALAIVEAVLDRVNRARSLEATRAPAKQPLH